MQRLLRQGILLKRSQERAKAEKFVAWALQLALKGSLVAVKWKPPDVEAADEGYSEFFAAVITSTNYWPGDPAGEVHIKFTGDNWSDTLEFKHRDDFDNKVEFINLNTIY